MLDNSVLAWYHEVISSARFGLPACGLFFVSIVATSTIGLDQTHLDVLGHRFGFGLAD
jgi:hypothetical protein